jgi:uncharacterized membrane protein YtjA (UPF0391 family)
LSWVLEKWGREKPFLQNKMKSFKPSEASQIIAVCAFKTCHRAFCIRISLRAFKTIKFPSKFHWHEFCKMDDNITKHRKRNFMLGWTILFLIIAVVAGLLGFGGIAGAAMGIAQIIFAIFLILFLVSLILHLSAK